VEDDTGARRRLEREARVLATLNHPNVATIFGFEVLDGAPYLVLEKVEGGTLGDRLKRPLSFAEAISIAIQIADGLAQAHAKGVVHRDLKPSNVMLTSGGRVKLVDFGIAKEVAPGEDGSAPLTEAGTVLGTAPYMSPEQIRGETVDSRTDVWAFGCLLFEMLAGHRAFPGRSAPEAVASALRDDPDWEGLPSSVPPLVRRLLRRCLRKDPEKRLQHIGDARLELSELEAEDGTAPTAPHPRAQRWSRPAMLGLSAVAAAALAGAVFVIGRRTALKEPPRFERVTFRRGYMRDARFTPDGKSVIYAASWDGGPLLTYRRLAESPESLPLALPSANILAISKAGELAIAIDCKATHGGVCAGTLARAPLTGGSPREVAEGVQQADWTPDGRGLVVVRDVPGGARLLGAAGNTLYETSGHISCPRVSPAGDLVAFFDHPEAGDDRGSVAVVDMAGKMRHLTKEWESSFGIAWAPAGREIFFTASEIGAQRELYAVSLSGALRPVYRAPSSLALLDISQSGRVLLAMEDLRIGLLAAGPGDTTDRELSWLDRSLARTISRDGKLLVFTEQSEAVGREYTVCLRRMDGSPVTRLGSGNAMAISPDNAFVLVKPPGEPGVLSIVPVGAGSTRQLKLPGLDPHWASWTPDARQMVVYASQGEQKSRLYVVDVETAKFRPLSEVGRGGYAISPDGVYVATKGADDQLLLEALDGSSLVAVRGAAHGDLPLAFSGDGRGLFVATARQVPREIFRIDLATGERSHFRDLAPLDRSGVSLVLRVTLSSDATSYAYSYYRSLADIYAVDGLL
jgi:Tol biopolymer transport system component